MARELHGLTAGGKPPEYHIWRDMKQRCSNPKHHAYPRYGGRGIKVCDRWKESFSAFLQDVGRKPFEGASIDRVDGNKSYEPGNVRWTNDKTQSTNRRNVVRLMMDGEEVSLKEYCNRVGMNYGTVKSRIKRDGWPLHEAIKPGDSFRFRPNGTANLRGL